VTPLPATSLYAALLVGLYLALAARVIRGRKGKRIDMGTGEDRLFERHVRAHGNFAEYAPLGLVLLLLLELQGRPAWLLHALGLALLAGRALHAWSFSAAERRPLSRVAGTALTLTMLGAAALLLLAAAAS
jgi:uncharacterized protein